MANTAYPLGAQKFLSAGVNLVSDTIKACLLPNGYTYSTAHEFVAALGTRIGTDQELASKSVTAGVFDADDLDFGTLAPGDTVKAIALYKDTGNTSTSPVLIYMDVVTGLPMSTNGGNFTVPWSNGAGKIARAAGPWYPLGANKLLSGAVNFPSDTIKVALLPSSYTYDANHEFLSAVGTRIGTDQTLTSKSVLNGVLDAADADFGAIVSGSTIGSAIMYKDTGNAATSPLLMRFTDVAGLPLATNGGGILLQWSNGSAKIVSMLPA